MTLTALLLLIHLGLFPAPRIGHLQMPAQYWAWTLEAAAETGLDPCDLAGLMAIESQYDPRASSEKGRCFGLMQLCPEAARWAKVNRHDPRENILGGARVLARLLKKHRGDLRKAVVAYNGKGSQAYLREVMKAVRQARERMMEVGGG